MIKKNIILLLIFILYLFSQGQDLNNGLIAYFPFNGNANDESGYHHDGIVHGATLTTDRFGNPNSAYFFDGIDDYIETDVFTWDDNWTITGWFYFSATTNIQNRTIIRQGSDINASRIQLLVSNPPSNNPLRWDVKGPKNAFDRVTNETIIPNTWRFFAFIRDNNLFKLYIDSHFLDSIIIDVGKIFISDPLLIGAFIGNNPSFWRGKIDEIRIYDRTLTENEISQLYNQVPTSGLIAYYPFNGNANDESGNGHNGIVHGATLTTDRFGNSNSAYFFNGLSDYIEIANDSKFNLQSHTISAWVKWGPGGHSTHKGGGIFINGSSSTIDRFGLTGYEYGIRQWINGKEQWFTDSVLSDQNFHHIVSTYNGQLGTIWVDGQKVVEKLFNENIKYYNNANCYIGVSFPGGHDFFEGVIDDIRIYNYALTENEIKQLFNESIKSEQLNLDIISQQNTYNPGEDKIVEVNFTNLGNDINFPLYVDITLPENLQVEILNYSGFIQEPGTNSVPGKFSPGSFITCRNNGGGILDSSNIAGIQKLVAYNTLISGYAQNFKRFETKIIKLKINTASNPIEPSNNFARDIHILARASIIKDPVNKNSTLRIPDQSEIDHLFDIDQQGYYTTIKTISPSNTISELKIPQTAKIVWLTPTYLHYDHSKKETKDKNNDGELDPYLTWNELIDLLNTNKINGIFANVGDLSSDGELLHPAGNGFPDQARRFLTKLRTGILPGTPNTNPFQGIILAWLNGATHLNDKATKPINFSKSKSQFEPIINNIVNVCLDLINNYNFDGIIIDIEPIHGAQFEISNDENKTIISNLFYLLKSIKKAIKKKILVFHASGYRTNRMGSLDPNKLFWTKSAYIQLLDSGFVDYISLNLYDYNNPEGSASYEPQNLNNRNAPFGVSSEADYAQRIKETINELMAIQKLRNRIILGFSSSNNITTTHTIYETINAARFGVLMSNIELKNYIPGIAVFQLYNGTSFDFGEWSAFDDMLENTSLLQSVTNVYSISVTGGTVYSTDEKTSLTIPPNTLNEAVDIACETLTKNTPLYNYDILGNIYNFEPDGLVFTNPATLEISYSEDCCQFFRKTSMRRMDMRKVG